MTTPDPIEEPALNKPICISCANVIHIGRLHDIPEKFICGARQNTIGIDLVSGNPIREVESCYEQRAQYTNSELIANRCGPEGKWYQPKKTYTPIAEEYTAPKQKTYKRLDLGMD